MHSPHRHQATELLRGMALSLGAEEAELQQFPDWRTMGLRLQAGDRTGFVELTEVELDLLLTSVATRNELFERIRATAIGLGLRDAAVERRKHGARF
jgi:hypothetical protein